MSSTRDLLKSLKIGIGAGTVATLSYNFLLEAVCSAQECTPVMPSATRVVLTSAIMFPLTCGLWTSLFSFDAKKNSKSNHLEEREKRLIV